ncbi:MAG: hypothetical protein DSY46_05585 [Hydrogenimonas sp.]|nr:MAG: hypothetical protein DSY46_05585 [Hydrogenimonas sp.]
MNEMTSKEIVELLRRYRVSIIFVTLFIAALTMTYVYFKPNIYQVDATIEVQTDNALGTKDILAMATGNSGSNIDNVIQILQSRYITQLALKNLDLNIRYYTEEHFKTVELYKNAPFVVSVAAMTQKARDSRFQVIPVTNESFTLLIEPSLKQKMVRHIKEYLPLLSEKEQPILYEKLHYYGETIDTPWFSIIVQKIFEPTHPSYHFTVTRDAYMLQYIQNHLSVSPVSQLGSIVLLSFEDRVPLRAKEILDALVNAYIDETLNEKTESAQKRLQFIDAQLAAIHKVLQKSAKKLQRFKATHIITNINEKATLTAEKLSEFETKLYDIDLRLGVLKNIFHYITTHQDIKGIDVDASQALSPAISSLIIKIQEANELRTNLLTDYTAVHPDVVKVTKQLRSLKHSLEAALRSAIASLENQKKTLQNIIEENKRMLQKLPEQERKLTKLHRSFIVNENIYSYLLQKRAETAIMEASTVPKARVIDSPVVPEGAIRPKRMLLIIVGIVFGLIIGVAFAFLRNAFNGTIKNNEDIESLTKIPVYGVIPYLNRKNRGAFYEALRVVRTNLEFLQNSGQSKAITVTSSIPKEGKTTIVTELSKIIAKSGKRVIVLDLDMRRSKMHTKYNLPNTVGLSTFLIGKSRLEDVIQKSSHENLFVITSGPTPPNPSELLMSNHFEKLVKRLLSEYDYVLFDSPPIGLVTDAMIAMRLSDINLIVVRSEYSKKEFMKNINRFVEEHHLKAGLILNGVKAVGGQGAYGYGYGDSYGYSNDYYS